MENEVNNKSNLTIIIPTIKVNSLLIEVVYKTLKNIPNSKIFIISNNKSSHFKANKNISIFI